MATEFEPSHAAKTWALFVGLGLMMMGNGLQGAVLGLQAEDAGFGLGVTGLVMTGYFVGFLVGSRYAEHALRAVGHIRVFAALASVASSTALVHAVIVNPIAWAAMRFVFGLCMAGLYVVVESWLNDLASNETRGRLLGLYMLVGMGGLSLGQLLLNAADPLTFTLLAVASMLVSLSLVPITLSTRSAPPIYAPETMSFRELVRLAPSGVSVSFMSGAALGSLIGLAAVYAASTDMSAQRISLFLAAPMVGSVMLQVPIGRLSDRLPRRGVIVAVAAAAAVTGAALLVTPEGSATAIVLMFVLGGVAYPLYSLAIALAVDWVPPTKIVGTTAILVRVNGSGAIAGPIITALLLTFDPQLFFVMQIAPYLLIVGYLLYRIVVVDAVPVEEQSEFQVVPARASESVAQLVGRRGARGHSRTGGKPRWGPRGGIDG
jgi:MFS family permease